MTLKSKQIELALAKNWSIYFSVNWSLAIGVGVARELLLGRDWLFLTCWLGPFCVSLQKSKEIEPL